MGAGFLMAEFDGAKEYSGNTIRYNVTQNDGRKNGYGGIHAFGDIDGADVYNNTIFVGPADKNQPGARPDGTPAAIMFRDSSNKSIRIFNNLMIISDANGNDGTFLPDLIDLAGASGYLFRNNAFWKMDGSPLTLGADPDGKNIDPKLFAAGEGATFDDPELLGNLIEYMLTNASGLIDQGLDLGAIYGIDMGGRDFFGVDRHGLQYDIGAAESPLGGPYVPEPTGLTLAACGATTLLVRRRRRL
jgi:hypothetical protein